MNEYSFIFQSHHMIPVKQCQRFVCGNHVCGAGLILDDVSWFDGEMKAIYVSVLDACPIAGNRTLEKKDPVVPL
jgi:hypothetical protein